MDVDQRPNERFRVVQLTPPGSARSITIGTGLTQTRRAPTRGCTSSWTTSKPRAEVTGRGVEVSEPFHFGAEGQTTGVHPERADYGTFIS